MNATKWILAAIGALAVTACVSERKSEPLQPRAANEPLDAHQLAGAKVFFRECNGCHPQAAGGLGPALNNKPVPAAAIKLQVRKGIGAMPSFSEQRIPDYELSALVDYITHKGASWGG